MTTLELTIAADGLPLFAPLLEKGVRLFALTGCSLRDFLCAQLGLTNDYLDQRIQTLFLNARPVDDVDTALVVDGDTLALSAAMPGLVGATMRKGGRYAALRREISQGEAACGICQAQGQVTLKLFNMVAQEIGGRFLEAGVEIDGSDLKRLFERQNEALTGCIRRAFRDCAPVLPDTDLFASLPGGRMHLCVKTDR